MHIKNFRTVGIHVNDIDLIVYRFGVPKSVSEIIYNDPYEATLILRDTNK